MVESNEVVSTFIVISVRYTRKESAVAFRLKNIPMEFIYIFIYNINIYNINYKLIFNNNLNINNKLIKLM